MAATVGLSMTVGVSGMVGAASAASGAHVVGTELARTGRSVVPPARADVLSSSRSGAVHARAATAGTLNPVAAPFTMTLVYRALSADAIMLDRVELSPYSARLGAPIGGCLRCQGSGRLSSPSVARRRMTERVRGSIVLTGRTRFGQAIAPAGAIGRFQIDGIATGPARPVARRKGCLGADTQVTGHELVDGGPLPLVACRAAGPRDGNTRFSAPSELSPTASQPGTISGRTHGGRWLTVLVVHSGCAATAQATARIPGATMTQWHVNGPFRRTFATGTARTPGFFCVYLQNGGRWHRVPDGRISQRGAIAFFAGDRVSISPPPSTPVSVGEPITNTFSGFASAGETLWTFDSYSPCAATAQAQYGASIGFGEDPVKGSFSLAITSVPLNRSAYRCAYLQYGRPGGAAGHPTPTGPTLATASVLIGVG